MARISTEFGELVSGLLDERKLSLRAAMYKTGISHSVISDMRNGAVPTEDTVNRFAKGLNVDPHPLLITAGYKEIDNPAEAIEKVVVKFRIEGKLTPEKQAKIMQYVREVIEEEDG